MTNYDEYDSKFTIACDTPSCDKESSYDCGNWHHGLNKAKLDDWKTKKVGGYWMNFCSNFCFANKEKEIMEMVGRNTIANTTPEPENWGDNEDEGEENIGLVADDLPF